jgi:sulfur relay (sulfurtransferase) complex TusBCD TusD component (DsrE family)
MNAPVDERQQTTSATKVLFVLNDPPYGTEKCFNGLRLAREIAGLDARGITDNLLVEGVHRSTLEELGNWTIWADKVVTV